VSAPFPQTSDRTCLPKQKKPGFWVTFATIPRFVQRNPVSKRHATSSTKKAIAHFQKKRSPTDHKKAIGYLKIKKRSPPYKKRSPIFQKKRLSENKIAIGHLPQKISKFNLYQNRDITNINLEVFHKLVLIVSYMYLTFSTHNQQDYPV
jgi:hypothetical protein